MPYVQNTDEDRDAMLAAIGAPSVAALFESIPAEIRFTGELDLPKALSEPEMMAHAQELSAANESLDSKICFAGGGMYDHYIPPVVDFISGRSEFYTSYTPYQAEASQGNLQVFYEYQSLICQLTGMEVANASLYDGATALAEAVLMAQNIVRQDAVAISAGVHPEYIQTIRTYVQYLDAPLSDIALENGVTSHESLASALQSDSPPRVVVVQQPNFYGGIEDLESLAQLAHGAGALLVVSANPIALALLKSPGECGADIVSGEAQCLGIPPALGGPGLGMLATRDKHVRKIPGRIVGQTRHERGDRAYVLTLQTREQHIKRERATSNICTNHALLALRATVYLSALGKQGLRKVAALCTQKAHQLAALLKQGGVEPVSSSSYFNEFVIDCGKPATGVVTDLLEKGFLAGVPLGQFDESRANELLVCATEQRTQKQIQDFAAALTDVIE
ncbi:MAG: aminomethyl-transferring glycine dehydrogenase subunit GcvPA [Planctomycetota bacterium]|jgi:glycine dehydrogenase subunit 1|nr:aminomethyl-transferring glycine dehydrogenase subunit GcvPA [Planctomycetota bacterium]MDP7130813.1 aminomethyl-transferring glycine dehydrogenase subunit GcvPA [Planctomycetota bacterium]MDP7249226.1 aminomethyl-transferring glycine dehydrogenase subunit GcvPA [Planctomycetota bacterium]